MIGRERLQRLQKRLCFVLLSEDLSANSKAEILKRMPDCRVVQALTSEVIDELFGVHGVKVIGFRRSSLADNILRCLLDAGAVEVRRAEG